MKLKHLLTLLNGLKIANECKKLFNNAHLVWLFSLTIITQIFVSSVQCNMCSETPLGNGNTVPTLPNVPNLLLLLVFLSIAPITGTQGW